jgi:hypothetical protein
MRDDGWLFRRSANHKQRVSNIQNVKTDSPVSEAKGSTLNVSCPWPPVKVALPILTLNFLLKTFFEKELIKTNEIAISAKWQAF